MIPTAEALRLAMEANLDLVEVASDAKPPVCRIMDYGKLKYERKKKTSKNTKQHQVQLKEIRMRPKIGKHDIEFKLKSARKFLEQKDKVKFNIMFRGRENAHHELGRTILGEIQEQLSEIAKSRAGRNDGQWTKHDHGTGAPFITDPRSAEIGNNLVF